MRALALAAPLVAGGCGIVGCAPPDGAPTSPEPARASSPADAAAAPASSAGAPTAATGPGDATAALDDLPIPTGWMRSVPSGDLITDHRDARLIARLGHAEIDAAERWLGAPTGAGELRGWWLRPITPRPTGAWLLFSVSGAIYGVVGPPGLFDDPGLSALVRVGRSWGSRLRRATAD